MTVAVLSDPHVKDSQPQGFQLPPDSSAQRIAQTTQELELSRTTEKVKFHRAAGLLHGLIVFVVADWAACYALVRVK